MFSLVPESVAITACDTSPRLKSLRSISVVERFKMYFLSELFAVITPVSVNMDQINYLLFVWLVVNISAICIFAENIFIIKHIVVNLTPFYFSQRNWSASASTSAWRPLS